MKQLVILGFNDHADGNAYLEERHFVFQIDVMPTVLDILNRCDHVLALKETTYNIIEHDFNTLRENAIIFHRGIKY